jgi:hypothetical protein
MNISEMHQYFRQYAQQMGMQNVRAILPEQIDILINTSISDTVNQIIKENIGITSDRVITDNSKLGSVNALSSLYRVEVHTVCAQDEQDRTGMFSQGDNNGHIIHLRTTVEDITSMGGSMFTVDINYLYIVDFAINYKRDKFVTNYFPIRVIDDVYLADVLNDFVLCPRFRSPVMTIYNNEFDANDIGYPEFNLYIDKGETIWYDDIECVGAKLYNGLVPNDIRISYIGKPNKVEFNEDNEGNSIDCNLPSYMHVDIVKHAVDLYHTALQGSLYAAQQAQQVQQRENIRNNAQPSN